jgi:ACS family glucarate transporter-like MFS transporter
MSNLELPPSPTPERPSWVRYEVLFWLCVATAIAYIDRGSIQVVHDSISAALEPESEFVDPEITESNRLYWMGLVMSSFFVTYAIFQFPGAWVGQQWGERWSLPAFSAVWSLSTLWCGLAQSWWSLIGARLLMGAAEAALFPCAASSLGRWFPMTRRAYVSGVLGAFMGVGGLLGTLLTSILFVYLDWRVLFFAYAVPGLLWSLWFAWWYRERPEEHAGVNDLELAVIRGAVDENEPVRKPTAHEPEKIPWLAILLSLNMNQLNLQQFFRALGFTFFMTWFPRYLHETRHLNLQASGVIASLPHLAALFGSLFGGIASDWVLARTGSYVWGRKGLAVVGLLLCAFFSGLSYWVSDPFAAVAVISLGVFLSGLAGPAAYAMTIDLGGNHVRTVFASMNMAGNIGAILFPVLVSWLVRMFNSWDVVLVIFVLVYVAAALCWLGIDVNRKIA